MRPGNGSAQVLVMMISICGDSEVLVSIYVKKWDTSKLREAASSLASKELDLPPSKTVANPDAQAKPRRK